jgi:hypothetical protein
VGILEEAIHAAVAELRDELDAFAGADADTLHEDGVHVRRAPFRRHAAPCRQAARHGVIHVFRGGTPWQ